MDLATYRDETGITVADLRRKLAETGLAVSHEAVRRWLTGALSVSPKHMTFIEQATDGRVTRYDLRPDIFGARPKKRRAA